MQTAPEFDDDSAEVSTRSFVWLHQWPIHLLAILCGVLLLQLPDLLSGPAPLVFSPFAGLALGLLIRWGWRMLPSLMVAIVLTSATRELSVAATLAQLAANTTGMAASYAAWLLLGHSRRLHFRADLLSLLLMGTLMGGAVQALAQASLAQWQDLSGAPSRLQSHALQCWAAVISGTLLIAPLCLAEWRASEWRGDFSRRWHALGLAAVSLILSQSIIGLPEGAAPLLLIPLALLTGLALRSSLLLSSSTALAMALALLLRQRLAPVPLFLDEQGPSLLWISLCAPPLLVILARATQGELDLQAHSWRRALGASGVAFAEWHAQGLRSYRSPAWMLLMGHSEHSRAHADDWLDRLHPLDRMRVEQALERIQAGENECEAEVRLRDDDGRWQPYQLRLQVFARDLKGRTSQWLTCLSDISDLRQARAQRRLVSHLFEQVHEGLLITDTEQRILDANPAYCRLVGQEREAVLGQPVAALDAYALRVAGHDPNAIQAQLHATGHWQGLVRNSEANQQPRSLRVSISRVPASDGQAAYDVLTIQDLSTELQQRELIERQAHYDLKTGLPNASAFMERVQAACRQSLAEGFMLCICQLDLDQFKRINQALGEQIGDRILGEVAERLRSSLRHASQWSDEVARLGGDDFALLLRCNTEEEARLAVERFQTVLRAPFYFDDKQAPLNLSASIGATLFPKDGSGPETLARHAAHALYRVKRSGRDSYEFFDTAKRQRNEQRVLALGRMQQALDSGELQLYYQPKVDMRSGKVLGMEALIRWHHPERGVLAPGHFLPLIEQTGLGVQVGDWTLEQAMRQSAQWLQQGLKLDISVNMSARHLQMEDFTLRLKELLARHPAEVARHLTLEVLESAALADIDATHALIQRCRSLGVSCALDDFGTGYSNLTYLKRLPVDTLKIDRSFVQNMLIDAQDRALVEGVMGLARTFGCAVVAEGVESAAHAEALMALSCHIGQGNGISPAMPAAQVPEWVQHFEASPSFGGLVRVGAGAKAG